MTKLLEEAFQKAATLPEGDQDAIAAILLEEIKSEQKWNELFSRPEGQSALEKLAAEAKEEIDAGKTTPLEFKR